MDREVKNTSSNEKTAFALEKKAGVFGVLSNAVLFAAKFTVGLLLRSITVAADALNNLSDGASSVVTLVGYKIASRPADKSHPYGHARFEYVAALVIAVVMLMIGALFLKESVTSIFSPRALSEVGVYAYLVLGFSALLKGGQAVVYSRTYRKTRSLPMKAAAIDSVWDVASTLTALLSTLIFDLTGKNADGYFGTVISVFIIVSAIRVLRESVSPLLGDAPLESLVRDLRERILSFPGVLGVHDILVHSYGIGHVYAVVHVEVSADETLTAAHELIDRIEREISAKTGISLVAHVDPIEDDFAAAAQLKEQVFAVLSERFAVSAIHDFRTVKKGETLGLFFDVEIPWETEVSAEELVAALREDFSAEYEYFVTVDKK